MAIERDEIISAVARILGETDTEPLESIGCAFDAIGARELIDVATEAKTIYLGDGMPTKDGSRKRTLGGIFFHLLHPRLSAQQRHIVWPERAERRKHKKQEMESIQE